MSLRYDNDNANQFIDDMESAGYNVWHYKGRWYWSGPAVEVPINELQHAIRATEIELQWDNLGLKNYVVYPVERSGEPVSE